MNLSDQIAVIAAAISSVSAGISVIAIYVPWRNNHDSEIFRESILALERSFQSLMRDGPPDGLPLADRVAWLTAARHLESFKKLRGSLKSKLFQRLAAEHEEFWRNEFYLALVRNRFIPESYFEQGQIEPRSAVIIFGFAAWPNGREDPIDNLDIPALFEESNLLAGNHGLRHYLARHGRFGIEP